MDLALLKAEMRKVWGRPIFELAVALVFFISLNSVQTLFEITTVSGFESQFNRILPQSIIAITGAQMLPMVLLCGILVSLSFARDYEQGQIQTLLSLPISRTSLFTIKFVAVVLPLTLLSWGLTLFVLLLNYCSNATSNLVVIQSASWALPVTFFAVMFYAGLAAMIALALKRTIASTLTTVLAGFFVWFITTLTPEMLGSIADYLVFTPYKAPIMTLERVFGISLMHEPGLETTVPPWGFFLLLIFYAVVFLVPTYIYFTKKFEVKE
jgi:ABC-type transport system involved in multi-copper enzyme maturation permease subunit